MKRTIVPVTVLAFAALAQGQSSSDCRAQRFHPDFQPRSLEFGVDVEINDEHLIVVDRFGGADIYTYRKDAATGAWVLNQKVPGGSGGDAVLDGDRFLTADLGVDPRGGARLYEFDGSRWNESAVLAAPADAEPGTGEHVALAGPHAAVGNGGEDVHIFHQRDGVWEYVETILSPDSPTVRSDFGEALEADGQWLLVGAWLESVLGSQHGAVYAYRWRAGGGVELVQKLLPTSVNSTTRLGASIALAGDTLLVGATHDDTTAENGGAVFEYRRTGDRWQPSQQLVSPVVQTGGLFGWDVVVSGDVTVVGARRESSGNARIFQQNGSGRWRHRQQLGLRGIPGFDYAESVALSGDQLVVGGSEATVMGEDQGVADVFDLDCLLCAPDLDLDGVLTIFDFFAFQNLFDAGDLTADFDGDGELTIFDFLAFQNQFDAGCE